MGRLTVRGAARRPALLALGEWAHDHLGTYAHQTDGARPRALGTVSSHRMKCLVGSRAIPQRSGSCGQSSGVFVVYARVHECSVPRAAATPSALSADQSLTGSV